MHTTPYSVRMFVRLRFVTVSARLLFACLLVSTGLAHAAPLDWHPNPLEPCQGHYERPTPARFTPHPPELRYDEGFFQEKGWSTLKGHVLWQSQTTQLRAKDTQLFVDSNTHQPTRLKTQNEVQFYQPWLQIQAQTADVLLAEHTGDFSDLTYRFALPAQGATLPVLQGHAQHLQKKKTTWELSHATLSLCPVGHEDWTLKARSIVLNQETGRGEAWGNRFYMKGMPILALPYFNFPLDNRRKTGFLYPQIGYQQASGMLLDIPVYWNIAPQMDWLFTPHIASQRGVLFSNQIRWLTPNTSSKAIIDVIPHDQAFDDFRIQHHLKDSTSRYAFRFTHDWHPSHTLSGHIQYERVSDHEFIRDFSRLFPHHAETELTQTVSLNQVKPHTQWQFLWSTPKTLHPVDDLTHPTLYQITPALQGSAWQSYGHWTPSVTWEWMHFEYPGHALINPLTLREFREGIRWHVAPELSENTLTTHGTWMHRLSLWHTVYDTERALPEGSLLPENPLYQKRTLPVVMSQYTTLPSQHWQQRWQYVFIPKRDQDAFPILETQPPYPTVAHLFDLNRFNGLDRVGDANRLAYAAIFESGALTWQIGTQYHFEKPSVFLPATPIAQLKDTQHHIAPWNMHWAWQSTPRWQWSADTALEMYQQKLLSLAWGARYTKDASHTLSLQYHHLPHTERLASDNTRQTGSASLFDAELHWAVHSRFALVAKGHTITAKHLPAVKSFEYGVSYQSCCWRLNLSVGRQFNGQTATGHTQYERRYLMQWTITPSH